MKQINMTMKIVVYLMLFALISNLNVKANGGPVDGSAVYRTGDIVLIKQANIKLEKEVLNIKLDGDHSIVHVTYQLRNNSYSKIDVTYGFPVDIVRDEMISYDMEWQDEYIPNIQFTANGTKLPIKRQLDYSIMESKRSNSDENPIEFRRNWYVVDFAINKGESLSLSVEYKVKNGFTDWSTTKNFFESYSKRELIYDFSPAQNWGDGTINSLIVEVDASNIINTNGELNLKGLALVNKSGKYANEFTNFDLKTSESLLISYSNEVEKYSDFITEHRIPSTDIKSIETSSELEVDYSKMNLFDNSFETAWVEGVAGSGIGEKIKIQLSDYRLAAICLVNGYTKNSGTYTTNNRIKKVKIEKEIVDYQDPNKTSIETYEKEIKDLPFATINLNNFYSLTSTIGDYGEGYSKIRSITITILEVYNGTKYDDTCISELYLLGYQWKD
jgi:hypothetical protein